MRLAELISKGTLRRVATATVATLATHEAFLPVAVATVTSVASGMERHSDSHNDLTYEVDRWCYPFSDAMNSDEIAKFSRRLTHFQICGLTLDVAERIADDLVMRDRDKCDDRHLCFECSHYQDGRCSNAINSGVSLSTSEQLLPEVVTSTLRRCRGFKQFEQSEFAGDLQ
jgi:hypothetical protein